jgi:hypothetical protein
MKAVRHLDAGLEPVRKTKRACTLRRREDGEAVGLEPPELIVVGKVIDRLPDRRDRALVDVCRPQLLKAGAREVPQLDAVLLRLLRDRGGGQVDRDAARRTHRDQMLDVRAGRDVDVKHGFPPPMLLPYFSFRPAPACGARSSIPRSWESPTPRPDSTRY